MQHSLIPYLINAIFNQASSKSGSETEGSNDSGTSSDSEDSSDNASDEEQPPPLEPPHRTVLTKNIQSFQKSKFNIIFLLTNSNYYIYVVTEYNAAECTYKTLVHVKKGKACVAICGLSYVTGDERRPNDNSYQVFADYLRDICGLFAYCRRLFAGF